MILSDLKNYIQEQKRVSLIDLTNHFHIDADALRAMLGKWVSKGKVKKTALDTACGTSCCKCDTAMTEIYEWIDQ